MPAVWETDMYTRGVSHTVEIPLFDGSGDPITTGTPTIEISKDSAAYAAVTNAAAHVDEELWTLVLTATEAACDRYRVRVTHADMPLPLILTDEYPTVNANVVQVGGEEVELYTDSSLGTGARTVTVTVDDGTDPLESARVRLTKGAESYVGWTDADGEITFGLNDGTWAVAITSDDRLHAFTPTTLVVDGDETPTYSMTAVSVPASDPGFISGYVYVYDEENVVESGVVVQMMVYSLPSSGTAVVADAAVRTETSDANGLVTFTNLLPGATYQWRRGDDSDWTKFTISASAVSPLALPDLIGVDD